MFAAFPLLALPVLLYNLAILTAPGGLHTLGAAEAMGQQILVIPMTSGVRWTITLGDLIVFISLVVLFIELLKSTANRRSAIVNHALSMVLFIVCLVEFLLLPGFGASPFFLLTAMVVLDVLAGVIVTIASTKRDLDLRTD